jgi:hypothetical protein
MPAWEELEAASRKFIDFSFSNLPCLIKPAKAFSRHRTKDLSILAAAIPDRSGTMHNQHTHNQNKGSLHNKSGNNNDLDQIANQLDELARRKLRDGCLGGLLSGYEPDIRQDSILLALDWYIRGHTPDDQSESQGYEWHTPRNLAMAMKYTRLRYIDKLSKQPMGGQPASEAELGVNKHPVDECEHEWPEHRVRALVQQGIIHALSNGQISHSSAVVARLVLCKGEPAAAMAKHLGVHRSAIYQHLGKVRKAITPLLKNIEVSYHV